jgi:signal transduction histidine kinase
MIDGSATEAAARYLERNADALVSSWIDWVKSRVSTPAVTALPDRALRNHLPPVLKSLAEYLRTPAALARQELLGHLRLHGQIRRDQGYSLQEVLAEFDGLADIVTRGVNRAMRRSAPDADVEGVLDAATRLAVGLRSASYIAMGTFSQSDQERGQSIAASLEEFAGAICHELRNPLNTLGLSVELLRQGDDDQIRMNQRLDVMESAIHRSEQLLDSLNVIAVAESARTGQRLVSPEAAVRRVLEEFDAEIPTLGLEVDIETLPEVRIEAMPLYLVLANVIGNAIKYRDTSKSRQMIRIAASVIEEDHDSGFCEIVVQDNGIGIPPELIPRVTQKGFRAHPEHAQGTGLGLHIVQQAVISRGGDLQIDSEPGVGTTLRFRLRCLTPGMSSLTTDQFSVEQLMGEAVWNEVTSSPELPDDGDDARDQDAPQNPFP